VLSDHERRVLEELEGSLSGIPGVAGGVLPAARRSARDRSRPMARACAVLLGSLSVALLVTGAASGAVALALATVLGGALWHYWPDLADGPGDGWSARPRSSTRPGPGSRPDGPGTLYPTGGSE
jgi:hypothetical protein